MWSKHNPYSLAALHNILKSFCHFRFLHELASQYRYLEILSTKVSVVYRNYCTLTTTFPICASDSTYFFASGN